MSKKKTIVPLSHKMISRNRPSNDFLEFAMTQVIGAISATKVSFQGN